MTVLVKDLHCEVIIMDDTKRICFCAYHEQCMTATYVFNTIDCTVSVTRISGNALLHLIQLEYK
jgi:hypothetical protein